jgi:hypothetical protein
MGGIQPPLLEFETCETSETGQPMAPRGTTLVLAPLWLHSPTRLAYTNRRPMSLDAHRAANAEQIKQRVKYLWPDSDEREWEFNHDYLRYSVTFIPAPGKHRRIVRIPEERVDDGDWAWIDKSIASAEEM